MKRIMVFLGVFSLLGLYSITAQESVNIDTALKTSVEYFEGRLQSGTKVVILNVASADAPLTEYIIDELTTLFFNDGHLTVIDRQNLEMVQRELNLHLSGEVSDESAQSIGRLLGAQTIISGSITQVGNIYRLRIRAIAVETAELQGIQTINIAIDNTLASLTGTKAPKAPRTPKAPKEPNPNWWKKNEGHDHWISAELNLLGGGLRYEYRLTPRFSLGAYAYYNDFTYLLKALFSSSLEKDETFENSGIGVVGYWYPFSRNFFFELGLGYNEFSNRSGEHWYRYIMGLGIIPGFGWKIDFDKPGGFFISPGVKVPFTLGWDIGLGVTIFLNAGWTF